ncbi:OST-HTH/LOTUS domain-containing protein [Nitrosomonas aestuarii]|uniref:OST-HTH/LOTUS domain-containing protein n=1 Tax=Nitrosomonas aestuarii TaxID=52441 RepID=UPI0011B1F6DC|nr:OST-HTH/LOTUS domain-containing protein [Nitrosomonas aestuarii]
MSEQRNSRQMDSDQQTAPQNLEAEVLRKIGRNLLIFQQIEYMLKRILGNSRVQGYVHELAINKENRVNGIQKDMLGQLFQRYKDEILSNPDEEQQGPSDLHKPWISSCFKTIGDNDFYKHQCQSYEMVREERNKLVHNFLPYWRPDSQEHLIEAMSYLDGQRERILPVWEHLKSVYENFKRAMQMHANLWASKELSQQFELMWLQISPLVNLFCDIASRNAGADGWVCLAYAGRLAHKNAPDDVANMKTRYGYRSFKKLLMASEYFEIFDEPLPNGRFRTFYRLRDINLHQSHNESGKTRRIQLITEINSSNNSINDSNTTE